MPKPKPVQRERPSVFDRVGALPLPARPDESSMFSRWPVEVPEAQRGTDIFIGGFLDDKETGVSGALRQYKDAYAKETGRRVAYFPNARTGEVVEAIRAANRLGGPVNVVGHSYGGPDAFNATVRAGREGLRVDNLVTVDPVTAFRAAPERGRPLGVWTNVKAAPAAPDLSDWITNRGIFSSNPSRLPVDEATAQNSVAGSHKNVDLMMREGGGREALDASRRPKADILSDTQPMGAWTKTWTEGARR
ncbi:hypothetical protein [Phenylobacterium sp.]|uniref:hypothetical protein n=1 Tax=Phenylobacterium sp. TaxID=1871053 RepID=UPI0037CB5D97